MARRTNIRRRGRSWIVYFRVDGKQVFRSFKTRDEAELYLAQSQAAKARGEFRRPTRIRFDEFAVEWLRDYAQGHVSSKTLEGYEGVLRLHLVPEFGRLHLTEITRKAIDSFVADWTAGGPKFQARQRQAVELEEAAAREAGRDPRRVALGRSPKTISNALVPLREMLSHAVEWGYLNANPAVGVRRPRSEIRNDEMRVLGPQEIHLLLDAATPEARTFLLTAVTTGMRRGELLGLRWGDVDWDARRVWVRRSVDKDGRFQQPKTRTSVRAIDASSTLVAALREHRMASRFKDVEDLVFPSEKGTPLDGGNAVRRHFTPALRRAKLPTMRFHDLRHSFTSLLIAQGEHPKYISEQLGHASVQITLDRYGHLLPQSYDHGGDRLEAALFGEQSAHSAIVTR